MLDYNQIIAEAQRLDNAEKKCKQVAATSLCYPDISLDDAYAIQKAWVDKKISNGEKIIGYKIGLTSKVMQAAMQIDEPDYGVLLDSMVYKNGDNIPTDNFSDPRVEVELAFVLKERLSGDSLSVAEVLHATDYVIPAVELIAARTYRTDPDTGYVRTVRDTISDNAANGGIICGTHTLDPHTVDLCWVSALLYKNNEIEGSGVAAAVLGHPALGIAWLAKKYHRYGIALEPNQIILSGSFTRPIKVCPGDVIVADYGTYGKIEAYFV